MESYAAETREQESIDPAESIESQSMNRVSIESSSSSIEKARTGLSFAQRLVHAVRADVLARVYPAAVDVSLHCLRLAWSRPGRQFDRADRSETDLGLPMLQYSAAIANWTVKRTALALEQVVCNSEDRLSRGPVDQHQADAAKTDVAMLLS